MRSNHLVSEYKYLNEMDVPYLHDSSLNVTEHTVKDELRKMASIYYCGKFLIPGLSEARKMAKQCINLDDDVQRKHVAKMASNVWKRATEETRISRNNYLVPEYKHLLYVKRYGAHSESELVNNDTSQMQN
ncbi:4152_t:CDS:2 [Paraglomus brasilianum]|uniref:4152_t:CDS:1 n=1 Tax=Paraglomus brasilianum TaxID=144538 RepID=A0A9N9C5P5_9GLOM|nr:4152_t:CDS:2 [Paraglomus brasilianum]